MGSRMSGNQLPEAHPNSLESSGFSQELPLSNEEQTLPLSYADNNKYAEYMKHAAQQPQMNMLSYNQLQQVPVQISPAYPRMPIPAESVEDPLYVNAKQYSRILKRREARAKLEAGYKLLKTRQPWLHKSRHKHAVNRPRGPGGRFLSAEAKKKLAQKEAENSQNEDEQEEEDQNDQNQQESTDNSLDGHFLPTSDPVLPSTLL